MNRELTTTERDKTETRRQICGVTFKAMATPYHAIETGQRRRQQRLGHDDQGRDGGIVDRTAWWVAVKVAALDNALRMFGLVNAPSSWHAVVKSIFRDLLGS
jgi:hypothetical protein